MKTTSRILLLFSLVLSNCVFGKNTFVSGNSHSLNRIYQPTQAGIPVQDEPTKKAKTTDTQQDPSKKDSQNKADQTLPKDKNKTSDPKKKKESWETNPDKSDPHAKDDKDPSKNNSGSEPNKPKN
jgi:hypothetical protein